MATLGKHSTESSKKPGDPLITLAEPRSAIAEAYRTVRTNLQFANLDQSKKSLLVTSAGPGEGKTTTVANLGVTMAMSGSRILLVDSDLRRPALHKLFNLSNESGLTSVLVDGTPLETCVVSTRLPGLSVLPSGPSPPNPMEVLGSRRMGELGELARATYDLVLYDSPPVIAVSDALVLAGLTDAVVLVVKAAGFPYGLIRQAQTQLEGVKANVVGILLNSVNLKRDGYYYRYYYSYYYGYGYGSQDGEK